MTSPVKIPFYARITIVSLGILILFYILHIGEDIILPLVYSTLLAILLNPVVNFFIRKGVRKLFAISIVITLIITLLIGIIYVVSSQLDVFYDSYPQLKLKFNKISIEFIEWISQKFNIRKSRIDTWIKETQNEGISNFAFGENLTNAGGVLFRGLLLPAYVFMILYYKTLLLDFIHKLFGPEHHIAVTKILSKTKIIIQTYLVGLVIEMFIIAMLNTGGLLLLGINYAIVLGIVGAILNLIPYIGGIIGMALPMLVAFITKDSLIYPGLVLVLYISIQFIDNNFIVPRIVASRVQLNALVSVIVVIIGGALWGIPGMFISIPLTAILKVIFDHIEPLKPWGFLLGKIYTTTTKEFLVKRIRIKKT